MGGFWGSERDGGVWGHGRDGGRGSQHPHRLCGTQRRRCRQTRTSMQRTPKSQSCRGLEGIFGHPPVQAPQSQVLSLQRIPGRHRWPCWPPGHMDRGQPVGHHWATPLISVSLLATAALPGGHERSLLAHGQPVGHHQARRRSTGSWSTCWPPLAMRAHYWLMVNSSAIIGHEGCWLTVSLLATIKHDNVLLVRGRPVGHHWPLWP